MSLESYPYLYKYINVLWARVGGIAYWKQSRYLVSERKPPILSSSIYVHPYLQMDEVPVHGLTQGVFWGLD